MRYFAAAPIFALIGAIIFAIVHTSAPRAFQEIRIPADGYHLQGFLSRGTNPEAPWIIVFHGNRKEGQQHELYRHITSNLADEVTVLAVDFPGFGLSPVDGLQVSGHIFDRSGDIDAATRYVKQNYGVRDDQIILIGHSFGALQVVKAAKANRYRLIAALGFAGLEDMLADPKLIGGYIAKFSSNTGVMLTPEFFVGEASQFTSEALFTPCPQTPVALLSGAFEDNSTSIIRRKVPNSFNCEIKWITIPLSGHMYGTETYVLPEWMRQIYSKFCLTLLVWQINRLVNG